MTPKSVGVSNADGVTDIALHDEIKWRAYELYERQGDEIERLGVSNELHCELLRVAYAAAQIQLYSNGEQPDNRAVRAARVYLRALTSFIAQS